MKKSYPYLAEEIAWAKEQGLFNDTKGKALIRLWEEKLVDETVAGMIMYRIQKAQLRELFNEHPFKTPEGKI